MSSLIPGAREESFTSPWDDSRQTYLIADFRKKKNAPCPLLVVYLHGAMNHQEQGMTPEIYHNIFGRLTDFVASRGGVYICPEYRGNSWMGPAAEHDVAWIIQHARETYQPTRVLLVGGSMGGTSALIYATRHPRDVDAILAFCPASDPVDIYRRREDFQEDFINSYGGTPAEVADEYRLRTSRRFANRLANLPIAIIHGDEDAVLPVEHSHAIVEALEEAGGHYLYEEMEGGGHDCPFKLPLDPFLKFLSV